MKYISLFSGIGGLEAADFRPEYFCEADPACATVLSRTASGVPIIPTVDAVPRLEAEVCAAGWPCQDLTVAGHQRGMHGPHSSLFFRMLDVARLSRVHTIVAENVPNLIRLRQGSEFRTVVRSLVEAGFPFVAWRSLNARAFGLPQDRERVILVASKLRGTALSLHRRLPRQCAVRQRCKTTASGFYWTGGLRSICYSEGYVPALKVGASPPKGGTSPVAVLYGRTVRKLSPEESVKLQGFDPRLFLGLKPGDVFRMAGNAVPREMGAFAVQTAIASEVPDVQLRASNGFSSDGFIERTKMFSIEHPPIQGARNLSEFLDGSSQDSLSGQAAAGLLARLIITEKTIPLSLFDALYRLSLNRTKLRGTKVDSFKILHEELDARAYREKLNTVEEGRRQARDREAAREVSPCRYKAAKASD